ncbi:MAG: hypothetical protein HY259_04030 [Chloroflexi bacterium]|nr:hypothetical protein [Chloroflexota bacterium]MBI3732612.1 hypothetical protein [Chloroflexota bacterium]
MSQNDNIATGAWERLRNLIGALDRVDRLETSAEFDGWLEKLAGDETALAETCRDFVARALRLACDPINSRLLLCLRGAGPTQVSALIGLADLERVELVERLNELSRAGLTAQSLEGEQVEATPLASNMLLMLDEISRGMVELAKADPLINPKAPTPRPNLRLLRTR